MSSKLCYVRYASDRLVHVVLPGEQRTCCHRWQAYEAWATVDERNDSLRACTACSQSAAFIAFKEQRARELERLARWLEAVTP